MELWTALASVLVPLFEWILGSVVHSAVTPTPAAVVDATPADQAQQDRNRAAYQQWAGVKLALLLGLMLAAASCSTARVIIPHGAVPVILNQDIKGVSVLVKQPDGTLVEATGDLYAGELVMFDAADYPLDRVKADQHLIPVPKGTP